MRAYSGQIAAAQLPSSVAITSSPNTFTAAQTFSSTVQIGPNSPNTQSTLVEIGGSILNPDANVRPSALHGLFLVAPSGGAPSVDTDFHGWDIQTAATDGTKVNTHARIYGLEVNAANKTNTTMSDLVGSYALIDVGSGGASGGSSGATRSFQGSINLAGGATVTSWAAFYIRSPFKADGTGGTITTAYGLFVPSWTTSGATVTTAYAVYVNQGGGAIYTQENVVVNNVNAASPASQQALSVTSDSTKSGAAVTITNSGSGNALAVTQNTTAQIAVQINQSTAAAGLNIAQSGAASAIAIVQTGGQVAVNINSNAAGAAGFFPLQVNGYDYGPLFKTNQNGGTTLTVQKLATGSGAVMQLVNKGTGDSVQWQIGATPTTALKFTALGSLVIGQGAQLATTATDGFVYLPSCAGAPTGVPTAQTGSVASVYDTTNNKLWVYNGAWRGVVLA